MLTQDLVDPPRATGLANAAVAWQGVDVLATDVDVAPTRVTVTLSAAVELGLLGVFRRSGRTADGAIPVLVP